MRCRVDENRLVWPTEMFKPDHSSRLIGLQDRWRREREEKRRTPEVMFVSERFDSVYLGMMKTNDLVLGEWMRSLGADQSNGEW